jgi:hypothetical protein
MSPFSLDEALSGKPVVTRTGKPVSQLVRLNAKDELWPVVGVVDNLVHLFTLQGKSGEPHRTMPHDLFMQ